MRLQVRGRQCRDTIACKRCVVICCASAKQRHFRVRVKHAGAGIGPVDLVQRMATDIQSTRQCKSRCADASQCQYHCCHVAVTCCCVSSCHTEDLQSRQPVDRRLCLRFIPVEHVCYAKLEDMRKLAAKVLPEALPARDEAAEPETVSATHCASYTKSRPSSV